MASRKYITTRRKQQLTSPQAVYSISCCGDHCQCLQRGTCCQRGFFSLWIQAVYGLHFAQKHAVPAVVNFGDKKYLFSDPEVEKNFWDYYYQQPAFTPENLVPSQYVEDYPLRIWERNHLRKLHHQVVSKLVLSKLAKDYIDEVCRPVRQSPTLGIHIRLTDHPQEVQPVAMRQYHQALERLQDRFAKFFIATDDHRVIEEFVGKWGARILFQKATRSVSEQAVHTDMTHPDRLKLGLEVLADGYALSQCQYGILVHSNVSYGALLLNPYLPFKLLETSSSRLQRWKTSMVYWLDYWGIRKM